VFTPLPPRRAEIAAVSSSIPATDRSAVVPTGVIEVMNAPRTQVHDETNVAQPVVPPELSVVVPVKDERENVAELHRQLVAALESTGRSHEILWIDDGSRDGSWEVIAGLVAGDPTGRVRAVRLRRNFGKAAALTAGFQKARGRLIFTLDGDLQDDPAEIPRFLEAIDANGGLDLVSGWKKTRHDPWHKVYPSLVFNAMVSRLSGCQLHDHNCGFKLYRVEILREIRIYGELHRFVPALAYARGFRVGELAVNHRPRTHGRSKYGVERFVKGFLDLLTVWFVTGFRQRPLHILGPLGLLFLATGVFGLTWLALEWLAGVRPIGTRPFLSYSAVSLSIGAQLLSLGVLAELLTFYQHRPSDAYSIAQSLGFCEDNKPPLSGNRAGDS